MGSPSSTLRPQRALGPLVAFRPMGQPHPLAILRKLVALGATAALALGAASCTPEPNATPTITGSPKPGSSSSQTPGASQTASSDTGSDTGTGPGTTEPRATDLVLNPTEEQEEAQTAHLDRILNDPLTVLDEKLPGELARMQLPKANPAEFRVQAPRKGDVSATFYCTGAGADATFTLEVTATGKPIDTQVFSCTGQVENLLLSTAAEGDIFDVRVDASDPKSGYQAMAALVYNDGLSPLTANAAYEPLELPTVGDYDVSRTVVSQDKVSSELGSTPRGGYLTLTGACDGVSFARLDVRFTVEGESTQSATFTSTCRDLTDGVILDVSKGDTAQIDVSAPFGGVKLAYLTAAMLGEDSEG